MPVISPYDAGSQNMCAFLDMIAYSEIGPKLLAASDNGYNVLVGGQLFISYASHPDILNKQLDSTAAGRYQLLYRYWMAYCKTLGLTDFTPLSQDRIAIQQIKESNAVPLIEAGQFAQAVDAVSHLWASLPGSTYGQHVNDLASIQQAYVNAGGGLA